MESSAEAGPRPALELWGGVECTVNRVGDRYHDQLERTGHADRPDDLGRSPRSGFDGCAIRCSGSESRRSTRSGRTGDGLTSASAIFDRSGSRRSPGSSTTAAARVYSTLLDPDFPEQLAAYAAPGGRAVSVDRRLHPDQRTPDHRPLLRALRPLVPARQIRRDIRAGPAAAVQSDGAGDARRAAK